MALNQPKTGIQNKTPVMSGMSGIKNAVAAVVFVALGATAAFAQAPETFNQDKLGTGNVSDMNVPKNNEEIPPRDTAFVDFHDDAYGADYPINFNSFVKLLRGKRVKETAADSTDFFVSFIDSDIIKRGEYMYIIMRTDDSTETITIHKVPIDPKTQEPVFSNDGKEFLTMLTDVDVYELTGPDRKKLQQMLITAKKGIPLHEGF